MQPNPLDLSKDERESLIELQEVTDLSTSPGWLKRILPLMEGTVEEAHEAMVGNLSNEPMTYMRLQLRWQQREAMVRSVKTYIEECKVERGRILQEIAERDRLLRNDGIPVEIL